MMRDINAFYKVAIIGHNVFYLQTAEEHSSDLPSSLVVDKIRLLDYKAISRLTIG